MNCNTIEYPFRHLTIVRRQQLKTRGEASFSTGKVISPEIRNGKELSSQAEVFRSLSRFGRLLIYSCDGLPSSSNTQQPASRLLIEAYDGLPSPSNTPVTDETFPSGAINGG
ncbi:hypothetical protein RMSM_02108 [Rhodopirellula maiorica SM1]|uniref:Uncharacterized protein n=1 Tax=Rhodopirellula maiorica SM1 TaxID=1265738 RepID=M5RZY7_9BACT|nr:hypothetical protein [Rhodopirellula maiorica]EMI20967.1 hypothetical protein RMSM_02108 [Rhodopirellula maiorica SM1]